MVNQTKKRPRGRPRGTGKEKDKADRAREKALLQVAREKVASDSPVTEAEAAAYWNVARLTFYRMRQKGEIRFFQIGDRILYLPSALLSDLEKKHQP